MKKILLLLVIGVLSLWAESNQTNNYIPLDISEITFETLATVIIELDALNTPYLVDVSLFSELHSPHLEEHILRVGQVFYQKCALSRA